MKTKQCTMAAMFGAVLCAAATQAQNFNIDVGPPGMGPPPSYAAAGLAGVWNVVQADHTDPFTTGPTPDDVMLVDVNGVLTGVGLHQFGGMDLQSNNDPSVSGDDANLLNDHLATHSTSLETCAYLNGLTDGTYEVLTYAWMPNEPTVQEKVRFDFHPGSTLVGGAWPGEHQEGVTFSRDIIEVTNGFMGLHVGIPAGGDTQIGAAWNGVQVRLLGTEAIPAVSDWGIFIMVLAVMLVGSSVLHERKRLPAG